MTVLELIRELITMDLDRDVKIATNEDRDYEEFEINSVENRRADRTVYLWEQEK